MRVLIVNQYFPPDESATAGVFFDLATSLQQRGHQVSVMCGRPSYVRTPNEGLPVPGSIKVIRLPSTSFDRRNLFGRVANYISYLLLAAARSITSSGFDVVVCGTDPPLTVWPALLSARKAPLVYSLQDLHPEIAILAGWAPPGLLTTSWERLHRAALKRAQRVVCITEPMARKVMEKGIDPSRVSLVHNGGKVGESEVNERTVELIRGNHPFVVVHAGNIGASGPWTAVQEALEKLGEEARFVFVGGGPGAAHLKDPAVVMPFRPAKDLPAVMASGDLQLVATLPGMDEVMFPSKFYTALAHGCPVLAVVSDHSELASLVRTAQCGLVVHPDDPDGIADAVRWAHQHPEELKVMGERALDLFARFERGSCMAALVGIIEETALTLHRG